MNNSSVESPRIVVIDIDRTLAQFPEGVASYAKDVHGITLNPSQIHPNPAQNPDWIADIVDEFLEIPERIERLNLYPGSLIGLHMLRQKGYIPYLLSARDADDLGETTNRWADVNKLRPCIGGIHLNGGRSSGFKAKKAEELGVAAAFDDDLYVVRSLAKLGIPVYLIEHPNQPAQLSVANNPLITTCPSFLSAVRTFVGNQKAN